MVCQISGYSREELIDHNSRILYLNDEEYNYVGEEKYRQIQKKGTGTVETRWKCKDGHVIDVLLSSTPLDISDLSKGVTFTVMDISAQNKLKTDLQQNEKKLQSTIEGYKDFF